MSYVYRCNRCRTRNTLPRALEDYRHPYKCKACGHGRFYVDKERVLRKSCTCDGGFLGRTGSIPHRPGSPCCVLHPKHAINRALRMGASAEDVMEITIDLIWAGEGGRICTSAEAPF